VSTCDRCIERLYDEDVRQALATGQPLPADLRLHVDECVACRGAWADARTDIRLFGAALLEAAPANLERRVSRALDAARPPRAQVPLIDWTPAAVWAVTAAGVAVCGLVLAGAALPLLWQGSVVLTAAVAALSAEVTRQGFEAEGT
jgi:hypothetical protein